MLTWSLFLRVFNPVILIIVGSKNAAKNQLGKQ
jgi:hypothetical protein